MEYGRVRSGHVRGKRDGIIDGVVVQDPTHRFDVEEGKFLQSCMV